MSGDAHVRFCVGLGVKSPGATLQKWPKIVLKGTSLSVEVFVCNPGAHTKSTHFRAHNSGVSA